jgi:D-inositol-3-phosphate glycosyltransferase
VLDGVTGRLVTPDEPSSWTNALTRLLREPHVAEGMGQAGVEHIRQHFSPERIAAQMLTVYETAIWRRGRER